MIVADLPPPVLAGRLRSGQLLLPIGPFVARLQSPLPEVAQAIGQAYRHHAALPHDGYADVHLAVQPGRGLKQWLLPDVQVMADGAVLGRCPRPQAAQLLEQAMDAWVAGHAHPYLALRIAAVARDGLALLLLGTGRGAEAHTPPGAPRSSQWLARRLCAGLVDRGWRLLGESVVLYDMASGLLHGMPRPLRLATADTTGGLLPPPADSVARAAEPAWPAWLVVVDDGGAAPGVGPAAVARGASAPPLSARASAPPMSARASAPPASARASAPLSASAPPTPQACSAAEAFMALTERTSRYHRHGLPAFRALGDLIDQCSCHHLPVANSADALDQLTHLTRQPPCPVERVC